VALITAVSGLLTGYFGRSTSGELAQANKQIVDLRDQLRDARYALQELKQRVRDILGPKERILQRMSLSLERMRGDPGVSQDHRERLSEIAQDLKSIDDRVMSIVDQ
jgi:chromosome segregation ATPase